MYSVFGGKKVAGRKSVKTDRGQLTVAFDAHMDYCQDESILRRQRRHEATDRDLSVEGVRSGGA